MYRVGAHPRMAWIYREQRAKERATRANTGAVVEPHPSIRITLADGSKSPLDMARLNTIICNYPNGDMVGHTGVMEAAVKAVEALDHCVEQVAKAVESVGGQLLITADHGNAEQMRDPATGQAHTAHTNLPVPLIYVGNKNVKAVEGGKLSDIAPTMLTLMGMEIPQEMTGKPLFIVE